MNDTQTAPDVQEIIEVIQHLSGWLDHMQSEDFSKAELKRMMKHVKAADDLLIKACEREGI